MVKENFYTGEQISNSPPDQFISEAEAVQNASFGQSFAQAQYGLGGNAYIQGMQQMSGPGFSVYPQQQVQNTTYYNPYPNYYQQPQQYGNPYYGAANPIFQQQYYQQQQQAIAQQQMMQKLSHVEIVPAIKLVESDYIPVLGYEDEINRMKMELYNAQMEQEAIAIAERSKAMQRNMYNPYGGGYNYFSSPAYGANQQSSYASYVYKRVDEMKSVARKARLDLSIGLSKIAHRFLGDDITDEEIEERYTGKYIDLSQDKKTLDVERQREFQIKFMTNFVEIDPAAKYNIAAAEIQKEIRSYIPPTANAEEFEDGVNRLNIKWKLEEEKARRRNCMVDYKTAGNNTYKYLVVRKKAEMIANEQGFSLDPNAPMQIIKQINKIELSPELQQEKNKIRKRFGELILEKCCPGLEGYIDEDGSLVASIDLSKAGKTTNGPPIVNSEEAAYQAKKQAFNDFLYSIPKIDQKPKEAIDERVKEHDAYLGTMYHIGDMSPAGEAAAQLAHEVLTGKI